MSVCTPAVRSAGIRSHNRDMRRKYANAKTSNPAGGRRHALFAHPREPGTDSHDRTNRLQNSSDPGRGDAAIYINGQRALSNSIVINDVDANSIGTGSMPNFAVPSIDSLEEFIVQTSMYDASEGCNAGGIVAAVTKSGTNQFDGDVYEFLRNTVLDGRTLETGH